MKMYFLLNMGIFQPVMLGFRGCNVYNLGPAKILGTKSGLNRVLYFLNDWQLKQTLTEFTGFQCSAGFHVQSIYNSICN